MILMTNLDLYFLCETNSIIFSLENQTETLLLNHSNFCILKTMRSRSFRTIYHKFHDHLNEKLRPISFAKAFFLTDSYACLRGEKILFSFQTIIFQGQGLTDSQK